MHATVACADQPVYLRNRVCRIKYHGRLRRLARSLLRRTSSEINHKKAVAVTGWTSRKCLAQQPLSLRNTFLLVSTFSATLGYRYLPARLTSALLLTCAHPSFARLQRNASTRRAREATSLLWTASRSATWSSRTEAPSASAYVVSAVQCKYLKSRNMLTLM